MVAMASPAANPDFSEGPPGKHLLDDDAYPVLQSERSLLLVGWFRRTHRYGTLDVASKIAEGVDTGKIDASFKKGVFTVTLPKTVEAQATEKNDC